MRVKKFYDWEGILDEEWQKLEENETLGERLSEIEILRVCMSELGHQPDQ